MHGTPIIDKGFYVLMANNVLLYKLLEQGRRDDFRNALAWWLSASKAYTAKLVNPGGDEAWKGRRNANITKLDEKIESFSLTPQQVIGALIEAVDELGLPHPAHIHCNNLGHSGNFETTLETMRIADGHRAHITHIQFHSYGQVAGKSSNNPTSRAKEISEYVNSHPNISADVGQVMFGKSTSMTADAPLAYMLARFGGDPLAPGGGLARIAPGSPADLCLLDRPWAAARANLGAVRVIATLREGRRIWQDT